VLAALFVRAENGERGSRKVVQLSGKEQYEAFEVYLAQFSGEEQREVFGEMNLSAYRRGKLTPLQLLACQTQEKNLEKFREQEPKLELNVEKYKRKGRESGSRANEITMQRRRGQRS